MKNFQWEYVAWALSARRATAVVDLIQEAKDLPLAERRTRIAKYKLHVNNRPRTPMVMPI